MIVFGIDQSLTSTGVVSFEVGPAHINFNGSWTLRSQDTTKAFPERIEHISLGLRDILCEVKAPSREALVVFEYPLVYGGNAAMLYALYSHLWLRVRDLGYDSISILPLHRGWFITGKTHPTKTEVIAAVRKTGMYPEDRKLSGDLADACVLAFIGHSALNIAYKWNKPTPQDEKVLLAQAGTLRRGPDFYTTRYFNWPELIK